MKPVVKIAFSDFWGGFDPDDNYFTRLLSPHFELVRVEEPDFLIYSCFGRRHLRFRGVKIFYTGENVRPDFSECDYAFTFDHLARPGHYRLPLYAAYGDPRLLVKGPVDAERILAAKTGFCNFVYSNPHCEARIKFFEKLSKYKRVDSGGRLLNNIGGQVRSKHDFLERYKFTIAFENCSQSGYTTEKLVEPMHAWSLPIYWGNPDVHLDFNPRSFINAWDGDDLDALVEQVIQVDRDDELYCRILREPWYHGNVVNEFVRPENVVAKFAEILTGDRGRQMRGESSARGRRAG